MTKQFEKFKIEFDKKYKYVHQFIRECFWDSGLPKQIPFGGRLESNIDEYDTDSYGNENSQLGRIIYFEDFGIYVKFTRTKESYNGEIWDENYVQVNPVEQTITVFEEVK